MRAYIAAQLVLAALLYALCAFVRWDFFAGDWPQGVRAALVFIYVLASPIAFAAVAMLNEGRR